METSQKNIDIGLLIIRIAFGLYFIYLGFVTVAVTAPYVLGGLMVFAALDLSFFITLMGLIMFIFGIFLFIGKKMRTATILLFVTSLAGGLLLFRVSSYSYAHTNIISSFLQGFVMLGLYFTGPGNKVFFKRKVQTTQSV